ncbi:hypothetical protein ILUMI_26805 [Ignelater luminosus]|uniref:Uncharacterized protein n=1 Tax=Ignelater luminosus TaxID=2038154 RepID=A0A8K0FYK3_IGNLU|nr:hypothetical protein ILUMI_26805 [Ignelater luminosus]
MSEIVLYCIFGDELIIQSLKIRDACYMSGWNMCGTEIRKSLLIIMERSKRPLSLTAAKFTTLSRAALVVVSVLKLLLNIWYRKDKLQILKSSFSYFAVLRKLYGVEE